MPAVAGIQARPGAALPFVFQVTSHGVPAAVRLRAFFINGCLASAARQLQCGQVENGAAAVHRRVGGPLVQHGRITTI